MPSKKDLKVSLSHEDSVSIVQIGGEVDLHNSPELRKTFDDLLEQNRCVVLIQLDEVEYMDSSGLATLIELYQKLQHRDGKLAFSGLQDRIKSLFEVTRIETIFKIFEHRDDGIKFLINHE